MRVIKGDQIRPGMIVKALAHYRAATTGGSILLHGIDHRHVGTIDYEAEYELISEPHPCPTCGHES